MKKNFLLTIVTFLFSTIMLTSCANLSDGFSSYGFLRAEEASRMVVSNSSVPKVNGIVENWLDYPVDLVFLSNNDALVIEKESKKLYRIYENKPRVSLGDIVDGTGVEIVYLKSLALSPNFMNDNFIYLYATTEVDNRVLRLTYDGKQISRTETILTNIPKGKKNNGGYLSFGPDGKLYIGTGDAGIPSLAQDEQSFAGKILRTKTQNVAEENNLNNLIEIYSVGHQNVQSFSWDDKQQLWSAELNNVETSVINQVNFGNNFGWGNIDEKNVPYNEPFWEMEKSNVSSIVNLADTIYATDLEQKRLWKIVVTDEKTIDQVEYFFNSQYGRIGIISQADSNVLWMVTNNTDGTLKPTGSDDKIIRLTLENPN